MARHFDAAKPQFDEILTRFLAEDRGQGEDVFAVVRGIIDDVKARGGAAVADYTAKFDGLQVDPSTLQSDNVNLHEIAAECPADLRAAIDFAHDRIAAYHGAQRPADHRFTDDAGIELGWRWTALDSVGVYVPGGRASYPSSVLMNIVPARIAGVGRVVMVAPAPKGELSPAVAYAALKAGVDEFYPIGGAQAVAALAFGAAGLKPVDKIVGPGNAFVAEAKRQVFGIVGIDTIAGPSEILVIADNTANPEWVAADLLSQAEHGPDSPSLLVTPSEALADAVEAQIAVQLPTLLRRDTLAESVRAAGTVVLTADVDEALAFADEYAPEHLSCVVADLDAALERLRHAGSLFLGAYAPESAGDYAAGSNHVLPTAGAGRAYSPLGVESFGRWMQVNRVTRDGLARILPAVAAVAEAEGLTAHRRAVEIRFEGEG